MKIINVILVFLMFLFAIVQWNDPDGLLWIFIYGYVAIVSGLTFTKVALKWFIISGIIGYTIGILILFPDFISWINAGTPSITGQMKAESPFIELVREFSGLIICLLIMFYLLFYWRSSLTK